MNLADGPGRFAYEALMPFLVSDILLVASAYDSFILEEEGRFSDRLLSQYRELDLSTAPKLDHVSSGRAALKQLRRRSYDLVITTPHIRDMTPQRLGGEIGKRHEGLPVVLLSYDRADLALRSSGEGLSQVFLWTGDPRLFVALVKSVEDRKNASHDAKYGLVRVIVVVEDSPAFYSSYLPIIYSELLEQVRSLLAEGLNDRERHYRMRARPKILLARTYEEGQRLLRKYRRNLLGLVTDMRFPRKGVLDPQAGGTLVRAVRRGRPDLPVLLQSKEPNHAEVAHQLGVHYVDKNSPELLGELREFMRQNFGFGPFEFRRPSGQRVARVESIEAMVDALPMVPGESLLFHAERGHFSNWLMARSEFELAQEVRSHQVTEFTGADDVRSYLLGVLTSFLDQRQRGQVVDFARRTTRRERDFARIGSGSMGGKARGLAFLSRLLANHEIHERFPDVAISVPRTAVICTDFFDRFCDRGQLRERALRAESDDAIAALFLERELPPELLDDLRALLDSTTYPLAVRSSSLLEDSEFQPLAGLYKTFLVPNSSASMATRLAQLSRAVRLVFASTFFRGPRTYMDATHQRIEEEKMAVIVERLVGRRHGRRFYPDFAGVVQSYNYYPMAAARPADGIATVALGLGETVVGGGRAYRFSPRHPRAALTMATPADALRTSQNRFYALDLGDAGMLPGVDEAANLLHLDLSVAEEDGTLAAVGATYSPDNDVVYDSLGRPGPRLINFAGVLKHDVFPLAPLLAEVLELGREGMGTEVELEFAVVLGETQELSLLQLRPLLSHGREREVDLAELGSERPRLIAGEALGNGVVRDLADVVYLHPERFDLRDTPELARQIGRINGILARRHRPYILIGPGRWGTADRFLGIPVSWSEVSAARVIVELEVPGQSIEASQGTHFFHNITSLRVGYFSLPAAPGEDRILDLDWLESLPAEHQAGPIRHVVLPRPAEAHIDGASGRGLILR